MANHRSLNRLTVKHLRALAALEGSVTLTSAALSLRLSQPALSNRLREIERLTDTEIFDRSGTKLTFTPLGRVLLNTARIVLEELDRAESYLERTGTQVRRTIRLEVWGYALHRWLAPFLARLMTEEPGLSVDLTLNAAPLPQQALLTGAVDISLALGDIRRRGLEIRPLFGDELVAVVPQGHPLAGQDHLRAADFANGPFVTFSSALEKGQEVERLFLPAGVVPKWVVYAGSSDSVCALVAAGFGVSILSRWAVAQHPEAAGLVAVPLWPEGAAAPGLDVRWNLASRAGPLPDPDVQRVIDRLVAHAETTRAIQQAGGRSFEH